MRVPRIAALSLVALCLVTGPVAAADGPPPGRLPPPADGAKDAPKKDDTVLRIERARLLVKELEEAVVRAKAAQPLDALLLSKLMEALEQARALAKPVKLAELSAEEKKALAEEMRKENPEEKPAPKDPQSDWAERGLAKAFEGAELNEEETIKARQIVGDWYKEFMASTGDSKKQSDLKRKRDDDLEKSIGKKKAQRVINNLNSMGPRGR